MQWERDTRSEIFIEDTVEHAQQDDNIKDEETHNVFADACEVASGVAEWLIPAFE
jgi:hypothetical protein